MALVRHLQVTLQSATFMEPPSITWDERIVYVKASHKNIVYTTNAVEGIGNVEFHFIWGSDGANEFHFDYEDNSEDITLELFSRDHICIGTSRLHLAELAKVMADQDPELRTLPVSALGRRWSHGSLALTAQIKRQQAMGKLGNLNVVLQEGIINSISRLIPPAATEPRVFAKLIHKHTTYTIGILRGERNKVVWHEHFTFRIDSWDPVDALEICIYYGAFQVGECKLPLSLFINLEEDLQADRNFFVIRTVDLLVDKRSVGSIKVAGSFCALHELDVLRVIIKGKRPELHPPRIPPPELPGLINYTSITNEMRSEGKIEEDIFHTDKSEPEVQLESKEIQNAGKPTSIGDYLPVDLTRDLLGASSRGYVIRTICPDGQGGRHSCALKRINTIDDSEPDLARLYHPHVVHLFHHWTKIIYYDEVREWMPRSAFMTFLMMELMDGDLGNLMTSIKRAGLTPFSLRVAVHLMLQIAKGMLYLHEMGVSHPHLKCNNVLCKVKSTAQIPFRVGDVLVKLGGFGCSRAANDDTKNRDVFCFGLTCLEILTGDECLEDIYGADKVSRPSIPETTPCILKDCIASCLDTKFTFSEAITLLLLAQSRIIQTCEDKLILRSVNLHIKSTLTNNDLASSSTSKSDRQEMFRVHQLHPQLGEVATAVQITLIFFHGFPKASEEWRMTWLTRDTRLVWPQMWLPEDLDGDIRVLSVSFDDCPDVSSSQSIKDLLQMLVMSGTCNLGETDQAIVLVGHSFGGVIIKALVAAAQGLAGKTVENDTEFEEVLKCKKFLKRLASIVFYSVPHAFSNMEFENYISGCGNTRVLQRSFLLKALRKDGAFISDMVQLSRDFENAVPRKTKLLAFLEGKPMSKKSLLITENSREGLLLSWEWHKIDRDNHFEVCRPVSKSHIGYEVLLNHLQQHMCSPSVVNETPHLLYGMNPSASSNELQGNPSWPTENWDNPGLVGSLDPSSLRYTRANRLEGNWHPEMILAQHPPGSEGSNDGSDGDRKNLITADNLEVFHELQKQWLGGFFQVMGDEWEVGRKIAVGAQVEIYEAERTLADDTKDNWVLKTFKRGTSLPDLIELFPEGMLMNLGPHGHYSNGYSCSIYGLSMLQDGRFAILMKRYWGDLRRLINLKMELNGNQDLPFPDMSMVFQIMLDIALGIQALHEDRILHKDLKATNVLIWPRGDDHDPIHGGKFVCHVADFECSVGTLGTGFWRAPEILSAIRSRCLHPNSFTEKSDVYSFAMTCYEILTGRTPFEGCPTNDYDLVLRGTRPELPASLDPWIKKLLEMCWLPDPSQRPSFNDIVDFLKTKWFEGREPDVLVPRSSTWEELNDPRVKRDQGRSLGIPEKFPILIEMLESALRCCEEEVGNIKRCEGQGGMFKSQCAHLVETLPSHDDKLFRQFQQVRQILKEAMMKNAHNQECQWKYWFKGVAFVIHSLVDLTRNFQIVVEMLSECGTKDWWKTAFRYSTTPPHPEIPRWSTFGLALQHCHWSMDMAHLAVKGLTQLAVGISDWMFNDPGFQWCEQRRRAVLKNTEELSGSLGVAATLEAQDRGELLKKLEVFLNEIPSNIFRDKAKKNEFKLASSLMAKLGGRVPQPRFLPYWFQIGSPVNLVYRSPGTAMWCDKILCHVKTMRVQKHEIRKKMKMQAETLATALAATLAAVQHPNVVRLVGCTGQTSGHVIGLTHLFPSKESLLYDGATGKLVTELMEGDLRQLMDQRCTNPGPNSRPFSLIVALDIMLQIAEAMRFVHEHKYLHGELKTTNILFTNASSGAVPSYPTLDLDHIRELELLYLLTPERYYTVKLANFGLAKYSPTESSHIVNAKIGSPRYMAPEMFFNSEAAVYNWSCDVYSFAMTCSAILTGNEPFHFIKNSTRFNVMASVMVSMAQVQVRPDLGLGEALPSLKALIERCWDNHPLKRPPFSEICKELWDCKVKATLSCLRRQ